jgi:hypothetical protein
MVEGEGEAIGAGFGEGEFCHVFVLDRIFNMLFSNYGITGRPGIISRLPIFNLPKMALILAHHEIERQVDSLDLISASPLAAGRGDIKFGVTFSDGPRSFALIRY